MLEVDYDNEAAIALYQRLGFEQLTARRDYYGPGQDALILKLYDLEDWPRRHAVAARRSRDGAAADPSQRRRPTPTRRPARPADQAETEEHL